MLEIKNLYCGYGSKDVIKDINLTVKSGEILCVLGPNGSGKSTLLRAIGRLIEFRGSVRVDGRETAEFSRKELAKKIGLLGQHAPLYFPYTVYDTVAMGRYAYGQGSFSPLSPECRDIIEKTLAVLELDAERGALVEEVSGGCLQRVFLARTLVQDPQIILLDEPTNHLDLKHQLRLLEHLKNWAVEVPGRAVIAVLHDLNLARAFACRAVLLSEGRLAARGQAKEVFMGLADVYGMDVRRFMLESLENWRTDPS
jgi:iron complex transport system ATP-binding protein